MSSHTIKFLRVTYLGGPNIWTYRPVLEAWVDIGDLEDAPSNTLPGLYERLTAWLPGLVEHRCGVGERGGFLQRLREGTWAAHILEHLAIELQNLAGMKVGFGKAREAGERGVYKVAVRTRHEAVGRACLLAARDLLLAAIDDLPFDVAGTIERLRELADRRCLGPSTACIVDGAAERHIPSIRLTEGNLVQLGYGARQRRIWTAETDLTGAIAEGIAGDKDLTKRLLASCGVPVPEGRVVESPEDAWEAAQDIGLPVAVKPVDGNHGRGVSLDLTTREDVEEAYRLALPEGSEVIVERYVPGNEHRLLVVGSRVVAAARGEAVWVTGDGRSTVVELIDSQLNTDPRRGEAEDYPLNRISLDEEPAIGLELARQGFAPDGVPAAGQRVLVQRNGNVAFDVTDRLHPSVAETATRAARVVGLDIAGIDLVAADIARPLDEQGGAIVEVNAGPGLLMHLKPAAGTPRPVGQAIADHLFPHGETGRIPLVGISGSDGTTAIAHLVSQLITCTGKRTGLASRDGLYVGQRLVRAGNCADWRTGQQLLMNRGLDAAVFEHDARAILAEGYAYDRCLVGVVTDMRMEASLAEYYIREPGQMHTVMRTQVDVVLPDGAAVLHAADPAVAELAELCDGAVVFYALEPDLPVIAAHRARGGSAVILRDGRFVVAAGDSETPVFDLAALPARTGEPPLQPLHVLAALGVARALGIPLELIRAGVETCVSRPVTALAVPH
ncbi:cyanophycin synthetase [Thiobacillus sedimenti]|uniref:Cyanophycin synthetase n=1 Tax=Thiobacillus sedimenti TaxID=3110231 RepID=A0ABZ1CKJ6_9PROT|nr:cyanophycin synthetase [Thiobacillus sp. SCUT-2]WRS38463.1 cyanophycin synthetase [Thiobacillus sp. SCUT-2]